jgi:hypothetical protein
MHECVHEEWPESTHRRPRRPRWSHSRECGWGAGGGEAREPRDERLPDPTLPTLTATRSLARRGARHRKPCHHGRCSGCATASGAVGSAAVLGPHGTLTDRGIVGPPMGRISPTPGTLLRTWAPGGLNDPVVRQVTASSEQLASGRVVTTCSWPRWSTDEVIRSSTPGTDPTARNDEMINVTPIIDGKSVIRRRTGSACSPPAGALFCRTWQQLGRLDPARPTGRRQGIMGRAKPSFPCGGCGGRGPLGGAAGPLGEPADLRAKPGSSGANWVW